MSRCEVIKGKYAGRIGKCTKVNSVGNVMFYPIEEKEPYRVCLCAEEVRVIEKRS